MTEAETAHPITGRCYCGATTISAVSRPVAVSYCHCSDCRRVTGAPVAAFAAFECSSVTIEPNAGKPVSINPGVTRTFCASCGSPLTGRYDYLPGMVFISLGLLDQADELPPELHSHAGNRLSWLHIEDDLDRFATSARSELNR